MAAATSALGIFVGGATGAGAAACALGTCTCEAQTQLSHSAHRTQVRVDLSACLSLQVSVSTGLHVYVGSQVSLVYAWPLEPPRHRVAVAVAVGAANRKAQLEGKAMGCSC